MGRGERRSRGKSWSPGCLQGAASSGPVVPLRTSLRLKCLGTLRAPLRTLLKHQSAVCAHTPPPPGSTLLPLLKGELRLHARSASAQAQPSHPAAQRGAPHPGPSFLPFSVQALRGPVYNYIGVSDCYMVQKAVVVATCSDATFGIRTSELKVVPVTVGDYRRVFFLGGGERGVLLLVILTNQNDTQCIRCYTLFVP